MLVAKKLKTTEFLNNTKVTTEKSKKIAPENTL
jgi:hypothetical protein